ncbi:hypothetical protein HY949_03930 [Candidatus Gottesmanbacteria bacterium]|nr:hypothetical protein [Candidatus Gottesmanbacteria bacterium]
MARYEGEHQIAVLLNDSRGCTYLMTAIEDARTEAMQLLAVDPLLQESSANGVCECANVGVTVYVRRDNENASIVALIEITTGWWRQCAVLNPQ